MEPAQPRGRPRNPALREGILAAARDEFLARGLDGASLEAIARAAGTSRVTIYSYFPSKEELFHASVNQVVVDAVVIAEDELERLPVAQQLTTLAKAFLDSIATPRAAAQIHALYQSSKKSPQASAAFYASGPQQILDVVERTLTRLASSGALNIPNIEFAAEQFVALVRGNEQMRALLSLPPARKARQRQAYVDSSVQLFISGYAP
ncbi:TetR/AcrR family transcriptional regulator [Variovorax sp. YR216]|uniref:TetR/AcrR family transcriptional regulator n=1 Tax=Variovorax sp. YR216 TaxID=1882828 RepID=UPI000896E5FC|nr:TetR/AcrR family transcriptional regulator [Variovorax sp. YR216]SEA85977.1 transcriptional regulator, TetR family [Variovorax sp. YR216]